MDYQLQRVRPDFQGIVVSRVLREYHVNPAIDRFDRRNPALIAGLVNEVGRVISNCQ